MEALQECFAQVLKNAKEKCSIETGTLNWKIRSALDKPILVDYPQEALEGFCSSLFASDLPLEEAYLFAWQLLLRLYPETTISYQYENISEINGVWIRVGYYRAMVHEGTPTVSVINEMLEYLHQVIVRFGAMTSTLSALIMELCEHVLSSKFATDSMVPSLSKIIMERSCSRDDLILHRIRAFIVTLFTKYRDVGSESKENKDVSAILMSFADYARSIDDDVKMKYLLARDLLLRNIKIEGFTDLSKMALLQKLIDNKALAPSIADVIVVSLKTSIDSADPTTVILTEHLSINDFPDNDEEGFLGQYLFPRIAKKIPQFLKSLIEELNAIYQRDGSLSDAHLLIYVSLYMASINSGSVFSVALPPHSMALIREALSSSIENLRLRGFLILCKTPTLNDPFSDDQAVMVRDHLVDTQLGNSAEARSQTLSALTYFGQAHIARLYKLVRDTIKPPTKGIVFSASSDSSAVTTPRQTCSAQEEQALIIGFWQRLVSESLRQISQTASFNKNALNLRLIMTIHACWKEQMTMYRKQNASLKVLEALQKMPEIIFSPLMESDSIELLRECALASSFEPIREMAIDLLKSFDLVPVLSADEIKNIFGSRLAERRMFLVDGCVKMLSLLCSRDEAIRMSIVDWLVEGLRHSLSGINLDDPASIPASTLGLIVAINNLISTASETQANEAINLCHMISSLVINQVSHPTPEGLSVNGDQTGVGDEEEDDDDDLSFSVMNFSWRAIKEASVCRLAQLKSSSLGEQLRSSTSSLVDLLFKIRHPGAFVSIARPLNTLCRLAYAEGYSEIPISLLKSALESCQNHPEVQTTRRSAGLPFCITAILMSADDVNRREQLATTMYILLGSLGEDYGELSQIQPRPSTIHSINIIRQIYRESAMAEDVLQYIPDGFSLCFAAFASPSWAVRNSGMMLFTILMNRTFGVRHDADDFARSNIIDVRALHAKIPALIPLIQSKLQASPQEMLDESYQVEFSIYPLLSFLQRLSFSTGGENNFAVFYETACDFCWDCLMGSSIMKVRRMCARLLCHQSESDLLRKRVNEKISAFRPNNCNEAHGLSLLTGKPELLPEDLQTLLTVRTNAMKTATIQEAVEALKHRSFNADEIKTQLSSILDHHFTLAPIEGLQSIIEGFWTAEYDLSGLYRRTVVACWQAINYQRDPEMHIRLQYLALTDDDEDIRIMAAGPNFALQSGNKSIPFNLRLLIREYSSVLGSSLLEFMPSLPDDHLCASRRTLFEPEPLNTFKDRKWEQQFLLRN